MARDLRLARYWYEIAAKNGDDAAPIKAREIAAKMLAEDIEAAERAERTERTERTERATSTGAANNRP